MKCYVEEAYLEIGGTALGEQPVLLVDFVLSPARRLILEITFESMDDVPSTVRGRFRQIRGFKVVDVDFYLSLQEDMRSDRPAKPKTVPVSCLRRALLAGQP